MGCAQSTPRAGHASALRGAELVSRARHRQVQKERSGNWDILCSSLHSAEEVRSKPEERHAGQQLQHSLPEQVNIS